MSMGDILDTEIERRRLASQDLIAAQADIDGAIEQFNKLDEVHRKNEKATRERLEKLYKESRHYTGKQPKVYSSSETETYPFYGGQLDSECNPYFPITKVKAKIFDGLTPYEALPTKTGAWARDVSYSPIESALRNPAMTALQAFPDISGETGTGNCSGETPPGSGTNQSLCTANGGTWTPPTYVPTDTATGKLRAALNNWKPVVEAQVADAYDSTEASYWQNILTHLNTVLAAVQTDVTYPSHTVDFTPGSPADTSRDYLLSNTSSINTHVTDRTAFLAKESSSEEQLFFGVIKLRLHQANGSFAKLQAAKSQKATNKSIVEDNEAAIRSLNLLKAKSS